jgi:hypothetical protein
MRALLTRRIPWYRTSKFTALPLGLGAVAERQPLPLPAQAPLVPVYGVPRGAGEDTARPPVRTR